MLGVINSLPETPYCMPQLATIYAHTDDLTKNTDSTNIWTKAASLNLTLPTPLGTNHSATAALRWPDMYHPTGYTPSQVLG